VVDVFVTDPEMRHGAQHARQKRSGHPHALVRSACFRGKSTHKDEF